MSIGEDLGSGSMTEFPGLNLTDFLGLVLASDQVLFSKSSASSDLGTCLFSL